jgi:hypothetical protein
MGCFVTTAKVVKNKLPPSKKQSTNIPFETKMSVPKVMNSSEMQKVNIIEKKSDSSKMIGSINSHSLNMNETKHNAISVDRSLTDEEKENIKNVLQDHFLFKDQYCNIM